MNIANAVVKSQKTHKRKDADFYPTPPEVTWALLEYLRLPPGTSIWEPACGDGAMSDPLGLAGYHVWASDLRDTGYGVPHFDFLHDEPICEPDWIITNPPFKHAAAFIERSLSITPNVAMLLKSDYFHAARREKLFRACPPWAELKLLWRPAFLEAERGKSPLMNATWWVWRDTQLPRVNDLIARPKTIPKI